MDSIKFIGRNTPNLITFLRVLLIYPYVVNFKNANYKIAFFIFIFLGITDAIDGILARRFNLHSAIGALLDPLADKILLITSCYLMWQNNFIPFYLFFVIILRDVLIVIFALISKFVLGSFMVSKNNEPLFFGKLNTALLLFTFVTILLNLSFSVVPDVLLKYLFYAAFISSFVSGFSYLGLFLTKILNKIK